MKKILLIGGAGYIGSIVTKYLLEKGYMVVSYDLLLYNNYVCVEPFKTQKHYRFINGDMLDKDKLKPIISDVNAVVLLAGLVGDPVTKKYPKESKVINDIAVKGVINLCSEVNIERFIFISTCSNYGLIKEDKFADENHDLKPLSLYSKSKVNAEEYILSLKGKTKMNPTILRFATAFGLSNRMRFDLTISEFVRELMLGNELIVYDENTWRPYCHVYDFARLILLILESSLDKISFEVFNAGSKKNNATKKMIVDMISKKIKNPKVKYLNHGSDPRNYKVNFDKVKNELGFKPVYDIEYGISELIDSMKNGNFKSLHPNRNFYGNYEIEYSNE